MGGKEGFIEEGVRSRGFLPLGVSQSFFGSPRPHCKNEEFKSFSTSTWEASYPTPLGLRSSPVELAPSYTRLKGTGKTKENAAKW